MSLFEEGGAYCFAHVGWVLSAPEPKAQVHYCDHALSVVRRPSVVRRR